MKRSPTNSAAEYPEDVKAFARAIYRLLVARSRAGNEEPIRAKEIVSTLQAHSRLWDKKTDVDVREAVNFMCAIAEPIASSNEGYKYGTKRKDIASTLARRRGRVAKELQAIAGLEKCLARFEPTMFEEGASSE